MIFNQRHKEICCCTDKKTYKIDMKKTFVGCALALTSMLALHSCYKEDAQELYQRQFTTSVAMADLQEQAERFNEKINNLELSVNMLINREPVSKVIYAIEKTDTVGAYLTLGKTTIYVPFGRDGKDGLNGKDGKDGVSPAFDVTIGGDGNWYINGQNTGKPARGPQGLAGANGTNGTNGKDGCTPTFSAAQDKENTNDTRFYWTVTWCDGTTEFIKANGEKVVAKAQDGTNGKDGAPGQNGATGPQGPKGDQGEPGVISPISKVAINKEGDKLTITTTYPDLPEVVVPLVPDLNFDIQPEKSKDATTNAEVANQYAPDTRELSFAPGQQITFPFTKADKLTAVYTSMPPNWKYKVNETDKTITITAPPLSRLGDVEIYNEVVFMARDDKGNTFSRNLKLLLPKGTFINYFYNPLSSIPTQSPRSPYNLFNLNNRSGFEHSFVRMVLGPDGSYVPLEGWNDTETYNIPSERLTAFLKSMVAYQLQKPDIYDNQQFTMLDFIYHKDSVGIIRLQGDDSQPNEMLLTVWHNGRNGVIGTTNTAAYFHPIPWDTYVAQTVYQSNDRSDFQTIRLHKAAQLTKLYMVNPHKWLGLPANEAFDASKVVLHIASGTSIDTKLAVSGERVGNGLLSVTLARNAAKYDANTQLLSAEFASFPTGSSNNFKLLVEYTRPNGSVVRKVIASGNKQYPKQQIISGPGGQIIFSVGTSAFRLHPTLPAYSSSVQTMTKDGQVNSTLIDDQPNYLGEIEGIRDVDPTVDEF